MACDNGSMASAETKNTIPTEIMAEMQDAAYRALSESRDLDAMRQSCARMDRIREENRKQFGEADIGVQIIRELRDRQ